MRTRIGVLALAILLPTTVAAQQIRGVVVEDSTFRPISDVKVELLAEDGTVRATTISSSIGWFELFPQGGGKFLLRASHTAYRSIDTLVVTLGAQEAINVVLRLREGPIPLPPVIVEATARNLSGFRDRARRGAYGQFITRADIDKRGAYSLSHLLRFTPDVRIERVRDGGFTSDGVFMRSFGDLCVPAVYLDGVPVPTGRVFDINDLISVDAIEGIEVYRSSLSAPLEFRLPATGAAATFCGVIVVWSRPTARVPITPKRLFLAGLLVGSSLVLARVLR